MRGTVRRRTFRRSARTGALSGRISRGLGLGIPECSVVADALLVGSDAVGAPEELLERWGVVPLQAHGGHGKVGPAVADSQVAEVDVPGPCVVCSDERVRGTGIAVHDDGPVDGRLRAELRW